MPELNWEPLQQDSFSSNVEVMDGDPTSLLNHYRTLIRLRAETPALGASGELIPLDAGTEQVAADLRRRDGRVALVVANLGTTTVREVALSSDLRVLPMGHYAPQTLLGEGKPAAMRIGADGRIAGYMPLPALAPLRAYVFEIPSGR